MRRVRFAVLLPLLCGSIVVSDFAWARNSGSVSVRGYYRKDGTYVAPHHRSAPDGDFSNNWSTKGNINPYTLEEGTRVTPPNKSGIASPVAAPVPSAPLTQPANAAAASPRAPDMQMPKRIDPAITGNTTGGRSTQRLHAADLSFDEQVSLGAACASEKGKTSHQQCIDAHLFSLEGVQFRPTMSRFSPDTRAMVEAACLSAKLKGPATYNDCLGQSLRTVLMVR
jgi:hypothetical protein